MTTTSTTTKLTHWQRTILAAIAAGQVTIVYPVASKAYADWHRPDDKPRHRSPTHTVQQLTDAGLTTVTKGGLVVCTRKGNAALRALTDLVTRQ